MTISSNLLHEVLTEDKGQRTELEVIYAPLYTGQMIANTNTSEYIRSYTRVGDSGSNNDSDSGSSSSSSSSSRLVASSSSGSDSGSDSFNHSGSGAGSILAINR